MKVSLIFSEVIIEKLLAFQRERRGNLIKANWEKQGVSFQ